jgi:hypothetical protein
MIKREDCVTETDLESYEQYIDSKILQWKKQKNTSVSTLRVSLPIDVCFDVSYSEKEILVSELKALAERYRDNGWNVILSDPDEYEYGLYVRIIFSLS